MPTILEMLPCANIFKLVGLLALNHAWLPSVEVLDEGLCKVSSMLQFLGVERRACSRVGRKMPA